jgi:AAA+ ATPase superfamily predicted ATPase
MAIIVGRLEEMQELKAAEQSKSAELIAIYGRRRIGKTYLIRNYFEGRIAFELTGMHDGTLKSQLRQFSLAYQKAIDSPIALEPPEDWVKAFSALEHYLTGLKRTKKRVVFIDEFPWLNSRKSGFLEAFDHFWNVWASRQSNLIVVICGSAASWMIKQIVHAKGGLHNRITRAIRLLPFTISESAAYLKSNSVDLDRYQVLQLYMTLGGVPHYLRNVVRGQSAGQAIDKICFSKTAPLKEEFEQLYRSLFEHADNHIMVVRKLAASPNGLTRNDIIAACKLKSGGGTSDLLNELEQSGFIQMSIPFQKTRRDALYRLSDEYSLFYLRFMDGNKTQANQNWSNISNSGAFRSWSGMAFEAICLKHIPQIKSALGIGGVQTSDSSWQYKGGKDQRGAQIDLLIDRADRTINICEMKYYTGLFTIDKTYAGDLQRKIDVFRKQTETRKSLFLTLITTYGVKRNEYSDRLMQNELRMDVLFE